MLEADVSAHKSGGFTESLSEKQALTQVYFEAVCMFCFSLEYGDTLPDV